jgi:hypothetical protein
MGRAILRGAIRGAIAGFVLALLVGVSLAWIFSTLLGGAIQSPILVFASSVLATLLAAAPIGIAAGALQGALIAALVAQFGRSSRTNAILIGVLVALWVGVASVLLLAAGRDPTTNLPTLALPLVVNIAISAWLARDVHRMVGTSADTPARSRATPILIGLIVLPLLFSAAYLYINTNVPQISTETHAMKWKADRFGNCAGEVQLEFVEAPGYIMTTCSPALVTTLETQQGDTVDVTFEHAYQRWTHRYKVQRVGTWDSTAEFNGMTLNCQQTEDGPTVDPECGKRPLPLVGPYTLR